MRMSDWSSDVCSSDLVLEKVEALRRGRERDPELVVLLVVPSRAEGELQPTVRRMVDREGLRSQHGGVPVGDAGDEEAETDPRGHPRERRERGDPLEGLARAVAVHRLEVVEAPGPVEAELLRELDAADHLRSDEHTSELQSLMRI